MTEPLPDLSGYVYGDATFGCTRTYLIPRVLRELDSVFQVNQSKRVIDLGCGNGALAGMLSARGYDVVGIDSSTTGIALARAQHPSATFFQLSVYDDLSSVGQFPVALCLEVIEHLYAPRILVRTLFNLLQPGGKVVISTPYHGYLKNLALALSGKLDQHFTALWDHGHIKFWSPRTIRILLAECGFENIVVARLGRIPPLAKTMLIVAYRPL